MEFAIISPIAGLEKYSTLSKTHLVLAHECYNEDYLNFYIERKEHDDVLILDNGAYEGKRPFYDWDLIRDLEPNVVVLPDYYLQPWEKTWHAAIAWLDQNFDDASGYEVCYIPQAPKGDLHGFLKSYNEAVSDSRISWIGIPRCLATDITGNPLARVDFARMVHKERPDIKLHAFGMVNGDVHEIPYLDACGVTSIDSSAPVWRGTLGKSITDLNHRHIWTMEGGHPVDFTHPIAPLYEALIMSNLEACGVRIPNR